MFSAEKSTRRPLAKYALCKLPLLYSFSFHSHCENDCSLFIFNKLIESQMNCNIYLKAIIKSIGKVKYKKDENVGHKSTFKCLSLGGDKRAVSECKKKIGVLFSAQSPKTWKVKDPLQLMFSFSFNFNLIVFFWWWRASIKKITLKIAFSCHLTILQHICDRENTLWAISSQLSATWRGRGAELLH